MRKKTELYGKEQDETIEKIIQIIGLNEEGTTTLYELENDPNKIKKLMDLIPTIRKFFSFSMIPGVNEPEKLKRPWLSIVKQIPKKHYNITRKDYRIITKNENEKMIIRTIQYTFKKKQP